MDRDETQDQPVEPEEAATSIDITLPEDLSTLTAEQLDEIETARVDLFNRIRTGDVELADGADIVETATQIATHVEAVRTERAAREAAAAERAAALEALAEKVAAPAAAVEPDPEPVDEEPAPAEEAAPEPELVTAAADKPVPTVRQVPNPVAPIVAPVTRAASTSIVVRPSAFAAQNVVEPPASPAKQPVSLVASGDFGLDKSRSVKFGDRVVSIKDLALIAREAHRTGGTSNGEGRMYFGTVHADFPEELTYIDGDVDHNETVLRNAIKGWNVAGAESLVAAGFCAPAQTVYDFCPDLSTVAGLWDYPSIRAERGRIEWPTSPDISTWITANQNWLWTEANDLSGVDLKEVADIDCTPWQPPCAVNGHYLAMRFQNMTARSHPELYERNISLAMKAHRYRVNLRYFATARAAAVPVAMPATIDGAFATLMYAIELQVQDMRERFYTDFNFTFEAVFPTWVQAVIRADFSRRSGMDIASVTDQMINAEFTKRGVRPQFVRGYQSLGGASPATAFPDALQFMIYPAGTFVEITQGSLDLGMEIRDLPLIQRNSYASFLESWGAICSPCYEAREITIPNFCPSGAVGDRVAIVC